MDELMAADGDNRFTFTEAVEQYSSWCEAAMDLDDFPANLKKKLAAETKAYFETGTCNSTKLLKSAAINPTLLEPKTLRWWVEVTSCPFDGYLPLTLSELETTAEDGIVTRFCQKKLKTLVTAFRQMKKNIQFHFHFGDDLKFCHIGTVMKFDVIDSSSLADDLGLANVLASCIQRLELNANSLLLTESMQWESLAPTVLQYVEESLCAPQSMIPTLYGLRLANHVELGSATLMDRENPTGSPHITLTWQQAPLFENIPLSFSPSLERCLKKLMKKCFFMEDDSETPEADSCGIKLYTPLTLFYVTKNLAERAGNQESGHWLKLSCSEPAPRFSLTQSALDAMAGRLPAKSVTFVTQLSDSQKNLLDQTKNLYPAPMLRLVLIPTKYFLHRVKQVSEMDVKERCAIRWAAENPNAHYIDNFYLHYNKSPDGSLNSVQVSFVLPQKHRLANNLSAALVELVIGTLLMHIGKIEEMKEEDWKIPPAVSQLPFEVDSQNTYMQAVSCQESETEFTVNIRIEFSKDDPKGKCDVEIFIFPPYSSYLYCVIIGLSISTDRQHPCEAAHRITFSLAQPEGVKPLTLCFSYPVLVDCIHATLRRSDRSILVVLKKALNEPWPCHFSEQPKWKVDNLSRWNRTKSSEDSSVLLMYHVGAQKDVTKLKKLLERRIHLPEYRLLPPLEIARNAIEATFAVAAKGGEFFSVCNIPGRPTGENVDSAIEQQTQKPLFSIRVHLPVLISPFGSPLLLISVFDHCLSKKLIENGRLKSKQVQEDFKRIFPPNGKKDPMPLWATENSVDFLRYMLRLNSTKMKPSLWQENNLPLGKYSPYLATYISPLYLDNMFTNDDEA